MEPMEPMITAAVTNSGSKGMSLKSKPVIVTCLLAILSFILIFTQSILNWIKNLSTDDRVWEKAIHFMRTYKNSSADKCEAR